jgi:hypothetical protein
LQTRRVFAPGTQLTEPGVHTQPLHIPVALTQLEPAPQAVVDP